jgi:hypothetical protein
MLTDEELLDLFHKGGREEALLLVLLDIRSELREMNSRVNEATVDPTWNKGSKKK